LQKLNRLECALMAVFWGNVLEILNKTSKKLQSVSIDLITVVQLYNSIIYYVKSARSRNIFMDYESSAKDLSGLSDYKDNEKRKRRRELPHGETRSNEVTLSGREHFIVMTYFFILDNLQSELQKRKSAYNDLVKKFSFFHNIIQHSNNEIRKSAKELCEAYPNYLNISLASEVVQLQGHIHSLGTSGNNPQTILELMLWIRSNNFIILYPYVEIALRIFLSTASTNCSAERSFSVLKRVKNYLRSTMNQDRCSALALLTIESDITRETDFEEMIILFSNLQSRRKL